MPRPVVQHGEPVNGDSFLDIVASVVSIMIIMVVMEGMRIKNTPTRPAAAGAAAAAIPRELRNDLATEQSLRTDILKMVDETENVRREAAARGMERDVLATAVAVAEHEIQDRRQKLDRTCRAEFDLARSLAESRRELEGINRQRTQVESSPGQRPVVVQSYPTPISRAVDGPEAHLLISHGRVVFIPLEPLLELLQAQAKRQAYKMADQQELTDMVGPVAGFRLRYTLERYDVSIEKMKDMERPGSYIRLRRWTLIPPDTEPGEPVRLALQDDSDFRRALRKVVPGRTAMTVWVYPDGFDAFRQLRRALYELGYAVAARPLPDGQPVAGSTDGSKSAAQ
jgi:hypothetical protein